MMGKVRDLLFNGELSFLERAIAREVLDLIYTCPTTSLLQADVPRWAHEWAISEDMIWKVIDLLERNFIVKVKQGVTGPVLTSESIKRIASAQVLKKKKTSLATLKDLATNDRLNSLNLGNISPSKISDVAVQIPKDERVEGLKGGYRGWFPSATFGINGIAFSPDEGFIQKIRDEHPEICIESALSIMFDELKSTKERPKLASYPYWIKRWLEKNKDRTPKKQDISDIGLDFDKLMESIK